MMLLVRKVTLLLCKYMNHHVPAPVAIPDLVLIAAPPVSLNGP